MMLLQELLESIDEFDTKLKEKLIKILGDEDGEFIEFADDEIYSYGKYDVEVKVETVGPLIRVTVKLEGTELHDIRPKDDESWHGVSLDGDTPVAITDVLECKQERFRKALLAAQTHAIDNDGTEHEELLDYLTYDIFNDVFESTGASTTGYLRDYNPMFAEDEEEENDEEEDNEDV